MEALKTGLDHAVAISALMSGLGQFFHFAALMVYHRVGVHGKKRDTSLGVTLMAADFIWPRRVTPKHREEMRRSLLNLA